MFSPYLFGQKVKGYHMFNKNINTTRNHYFPQFLIRNWAYDGGKPHVYKNIIHSYYDTNRTNKTVSAKQILFGTEIYDNDTESQTSTDDNDLACFIQRLTNNTNVTNDTFSNCIFLRLIFKLFARQPSLNETLYKSVEKAILSEPYFTMGVRNGVTIDMRFKRWVNAKFFATQQYDISLDYVKAKYVFILNKTSTPFILPDNIKQLSLPLTPEIMVRIASLTQPFPIVEIEDVTDSKLIDKLNAEMIKNCDKYYISKYPSDISI